MRFVGVERTKTFKGLSSRVLGREPGFKMIYGFTGNT